MNLDTLLEINRTAKLFVDRDGLSLIQAEERLSTKTVVLACGPEVLNSPTQAAAVMTAVNTGNKCFPGGVQVFVTSGDPQKADAFLQQAVSVGGRRISPSPSADLCFGTTGVSSRFLQVTFDRWIGAVVPQGRSAWAPTAGCCLRRSWPPRSSRCPQGLGRSAPCHSA